MMALWESMSLYELQLVYIADFYYSQHDELY